MTKTPPNPIRCDVPVFYATTEGQARRIAERMVREMRAHGLTSEAFEVNSEAVEALDWSSVRGAILGASVHMQRYQRRASRFVRANVERLNRLPCAFFSVSLAAASQNAEERGAVLRLAEAFPLRRGWTPALVASLAGRLAYTKYGFFTKQVMKRIARKEGAPLDTSRDYEFTNWEKVDRLACALIGLINEHAARPRIAAA